MHHLSPKQNYPQITVNGKIFLHISRRATLQVTLEVSTASNEINTPALRGTLGDFGDKREREIRKDLVCSIAALVDPSARMRYIKQSEKLCLSNLVSHIAIVICWKHTLAQGEKDVFIKTAWVVNRL
jgi:hypothetical protein